jgi:cation:H+ antiporter
MLDSIFNKNNPNVFSRADGIILILLFFMFIAYLVQLFKSHDKSKDKPQEAKYDSVILSGILLFLSIVLIVLSSDLIVDNAIVIAHRLGISEKIITMTAIVIGTSLPELFMTVTSAKKGEFEMTIGNIIGTNIFNICIVLGLPVAIYGDILLSSFSVIDILVVFLTSFDLFLFARSEKTVSKQEGVIMLLIFIVYYCYLFF